MMQSKKIGQMSKNSKNRMLKSMVKMIGPMMVMTNRMMMSPLQKRPGPDLAAFPGMKCSEHKCLGRGSDPRDCSSGSARIII